MDGRAFPDYSGELISRRFLVLLFADIADSTRIMAQLDTEESFKLVNRTISLMKRDVRKYKGKVIKVPGDGVLAVFGANIASQNDAFQACLAAREMHRSIEEAAAGDPVLRAVRLRVGIHAGNVIVHGSGRGEEAGFDTTGYAVNATHKIEACCPPGETLVSDDVATLAGGWLTSDAFELEDINQDAAGLSPRLLRALSSSFTVEDLLEKNRIGLTGREKELRALCDCLDSEARSCESAGIIGLSGIGKSRLALEVIETARQSGWHVLQSRGLDFLSLSSYSALTQLIPQLLGLDGRGRRQDSQERLQGLQRENGLIAAPLLDVMGFETDDPAYSRSEPAAKAAAIADSFLQLFEICKASHAQILLMIEDLHLIDQRSFDILLRLRQQLCGKAFKLLCTSRPEGRVMLDRLSSMMLTLGPLGRQDALALIAKLSPREHPLRENIAREIVDRTNGQPFGILAYLRSVAGRGDISIDDLPASIEASVQAQRDRLSEPALNILDCIVVSNGGLEAPLQRALFGAGDDDAQALEELLGADLVVRDGEQKIRLEHDLVGHASLRFMLKADRRRLHERLLQALESQTEFEAPVERLARHAEGAGQLEHALGYYWKACL
ncbi:MAG TPA: hypothetical protein EYG02_01645, partial [Henriciella marina]|nr:hypothetical protein [Henriciella marina]